MNTYFILIGVIEYEFSTVIGIYDSLSALKNGLVAFKKKSKLTFDYFEYVETYMGLTDLEGCEHIIIGPVLMLSLLYLEQARND